MFKSAYDELYEVEEHHWWTQGLFDLVMQFTHWFFQNRSIKILDAGCGTGGLLSLFLKQGHDACGFDISENALNYCKKRRLENRVFQADLNEWTPAQNTYDLITCLDVLYHDWVVSEKDALKRLVFGLKKNGVLILDLPALPNLSRRHCEVVMGKRRYSKKSIMEILNGLGMQPSVLSYRLPFAVPPLIIRRLLDSIQAGNPITQQKSDIAKISLWNTLLYELHRIENKFILNGFSMPIGSSIFAVIKKV